MTPELKQRLVGAAVLLFLAGLLWVLLFDFEASEREVSPPVSIPPMPTIEPVVFEPATPFYNDRVDDSASNSSVEADGVNELASSSELSELLGDSPDPKPIANKTHYVDQARIPMPKEVCHQAYQDLIADGADPNDLRIIRDR